MACDVITMLDIYTNDLTSGVILLQKIPHYGLDCLELAEEAKCLRFLSLYSVQNIITDIWHGKIEQKRGFKATISVNNLFVLSLNYSSILFFQFFKLFLSCLSLGLLSPFLLSERKAKLTQTVRFLFSS
jgi:hypothetical protein